MAVRLRSLRNYALTGSGMYKMAGMSLNEAQDKNLKTAFLSHSHKDRIYAKGIEAWLEENGLDVYIDWEDEEMPEVPDVRTAQRIQKKIGDCDLFLYLATENSAKSRWCPWEIGYADEVRGKNNLYIIPTTSNDGTVNGNEYLQLYRRIQINREGKLAALRPNQAYGHTLDTL